MAKDKTVKLKIRAYYEANNLSYADVWKHFNQIGFDVSQKTIEYWGANDKPKWQKGKYETLVEAIEKVVDDTLLEVIDEKVKDIIGQENDNTDMDGYEFFNQTVSMELLHKVTNKHFLANEMVQNLARSRSFATKSKSIGTNKTYHEMIISTYQTIHGRQTNIGVLNPNIRDDKELENMSSQQLLEILEG